MMGWLYLALIISGLVALALDALFVAGGIFLAATLLAVAQVVRAYRK